MLAIIGTVGVPACYGGFETLVDNLLDSDDESVFVYCSSHSYTIHQESYKNAKLIYIPFNANGVQSVLYDIVSMVDAVFRKKCDRILVLGVSGALIIPLIKLFSSAKFVTNIDGLEWRRNKWNKFAKSFLKFSEWIAVKYSDSIISDNQAIADYVNTEYGVKSQVIAYGGDHALTKTIYDTEDSNAADNEYALSICRIEPENNIHIILKAFSMTEMNIKFIGNWNNSEYGKSLKQQYSSKKNISLIDPIYDVDVLFDIRSGCCVYIHGHSAGGTNPSLVEMMHFSKPIIAFDCDYNKATTESLALFFTDEYSLSKLLNVTVWNHFRDQAVALKEVADRRYTWEVVKKQYFSLIKTC